MNALWSIATPPGTTGAIAVFEVRADDTDALDAVLHRLGLAPLDVGAVKHRNLLDVDSGVVARWTPRLCHLMPHGGVGVVRSLARALVERGLTHADSVDYPEATSPIEACMLRAIARAASPLAIDLLLDQPRRWASGATDEPSLNAVLNRLIDPPLVVAFGPPNIGKSTLINTLSGRAVSIVADEPGTTRDHVGVWLNLGGLVIRYLDTPGLRATSDPIESRANALVQHAAAGADLLLLMGDATAPPPDIPGPPCLRIALRADLGAAAWPHDVSVSAARGQGLTELTNVIRNALVPEQALADARPWKFWPDRTEHPEDGNRRESC